MTIQTSKVGKKGAARRVAEKARAIRQQPLSKKIFQIIEESFEKGLHEVPSVKKSAKPRDVDV